jgi:hypothetical protein
MHFLKKSVLTVFTAGVATLSRLSFAAVVYILAAQGLAEIAQLERYALLNNLVLIERFLLQPAVDYLHANLPLIYQGLDLAPYAIASAIIVLWAACEAERERLRVMAWDLAAERAASRAAKAAAQERARAAERQAEVSRVHQRDRERLAV